ncbi:MAG TPA: GTP-binding protein [Stellaceae bacterium]|nr:GTP-binding protein [Stellaceae bacterium]
MPNNAAENRLPVTLLTGFLGSGKTTLLRRVLTCPELSDTAVVINEVGEIAIDHYLVDFIAGDVVELPGGCLCCAVREDLARTLRGLLDRRDSADIRPFRRIAVETTGLADPGPILFTLSTDAMLDQRLRLERVVTVVDAVAGAATLDRFAEAARQAAIADALVVSKTDLAPFGPELAERLDALNPGAERLLAADADPAAVLFPPVSRHPRISGGPGATAGPPPLDPRFRGNDDGGEHANHSHGIATYSVVLERPVSTFAFARALGGLAQERGYDLLRVKGLVAFADRPERAAVIQAAQHAMFAPEWLDDWPDADHRNRLVFIVHDIAPDEILARFAFASPSLLGPRASGPHVGRTPALRSIK